MFATKDQLMARMAHIGDAPKDHGTIERLCFRAGYGERQFVDHLDMTVADGIKDERWGKAPWLRRDDGSADPRIQVCILSHRVDRAVRIDPAMIDPGDTIITDLDLSKANMPVGQVLRIGEVKIRVSDVFNDACVKWRTRYGQASYDWVNDPVHRSLRLRGILCEIIQDGRISRDDIISKVDSGARALDRP